MFILYAVPLGLLLGVLAGGRVAGLSTIRFRWAGVALVALAVQAVLFSGAFDASIGWIGAIVYVASTGAVLVAVVRNLAIPGLAIVALGAASNLAAILANGGYMPADPAALRAAGASAEPVGFSNSVVTQTPALRPLTDVFAIPDGWAFANVFSVGDVLIGLGVAVTIALAMRRRPSDAAVEVPDGAAVRAGNSPD